MSAPAISSPDQLLDHHPQPSAVENGERSVRIWGLPLARMCYDEAVDHVERLIDRGEPAFFITANLHYAMLTDRLPRLREVNRRAAFLFADGMPMVWYSRLVGRPLPERVTGADLIWGLCRRAAERGWGVFLLGGADGVARQAAHVLTTKYPGLRIVGVEAPELDALSPDEHRALLERVRDARPELLFAALGQPKGELWLGEHYRALGVPAAVQVGATLDFVAGRVRRAPPWFRRAGLEWLYRACSEPRRLGPRYAADAWFLFKALAHDAWRGFRPGLPEPAPARL